MILVSYHNVFGTMEFIGTIHKLYGTMEFIETIHKDLLCLSLKKIQDGV